MKKKTILAIGIIGLFAGMVFVPAISAEHFGHPFTDGNRGPFGPASIDIESCTYDRKEENTYYNLDITAEVRDTLTGANVGIFNIQNRIYENSFLLWVVVGRTWLSRLFGSHLLPNNYFKIEKGQRFHFHADEWIATTDTGEINSAFYGFSGYGTNGEVTIIQ